MSDSPPPHHGDVPKASPSHAPETSDLASSNNREVAALPPPPPPPPSPSSPSKNPFWTEEEHRLFVEGLHHYGKGNWKEISQNFIQSRTPVQVASHAQKYYIRQSKEVKKGKSIHDETQETVQPSCPSNLVTMQQLRDLSTPRRLNLNLNHPFIMPIQQDSTHHDPNQIRSVKRRWQQDSTHGNVNPSVPRPLQQVPARYYRDISHTSIHRNQHNRNIYPPPQHLYIDLIIQKSDEGHLDIFVKGSNQVQVQSVITLQGSPLQSYLDFSSHQIHIPCFCSESLPSQQCRVILKNFATQP